MFILTIINMANNTLYIVQELNTFAFSGIAFKVSL